MTNMFYLALTLSFGPLAKVDHTTLDPTTILVPIEHSILVERTRSER